MMSRIWCDKVSRTGMLYGKKTKKLRIFWCNKIGAEAFRPQRRRPRRVGAHIAAFQVPLLEITPPALFYRHLRSRHIPKKTMKPQTLIIATACILASCAPNEAEQQAAAKAALLQEKVAAAYEAEALAYDASASAAETAAAAREAEAQAWEASAEMQHASNSRERASDALRYVPTARERAANARRHAATARESASDALAWAAEGPEYASNARESAAAARGYAAAAREGAQRADSLRTLSPGSAAAMLWEEALRAEEASEAVEEREAQAWETAAQAWVSAAETYYPEL